MKHGSVDKMLDWDCSNLSQIPGDPTWPLSFILQKKNEFNSSSLPPRSIVKRSATTVTGPYKYSTTSLEQILFITRPLWQYCQYCLSDASQQYKFIASPLEAACWPCQTLRTLAVIFVWLCDRKLFLVYWCIVCHLEHKAMVKCCSHWSLGPTY